MPISALSSARGVLRYILENPSNQGEKLYRLLLALGWQLYKRTIRLPLIVTLDNGLLYIADPLANNATGAIYTKLYEPEYIMFLRQHLRQGGTLIDVGAQTGLYTLLLAHVLPRGACFEPTPESFELMARNLRLNALDDFRPVKAAVAAKDGVAGFRITACFGSTNRLDSSSTYGVEVVSLDSYVATNPLVEHLGLLKIDVEGGELDVLRGAKRLLLDSPTALALVENSQPEAIEEFLEELGWHCFAIDKRGEILISTEQKRAAYNLLACGPSHPLSRRIEHS
jgi:FkbM family methyltransferase